MANGEWRVAAAVRGGEPELSLTRSAAGPAGKCAEWRVASGREWRVPVSGEWRVATRSGGSRRRCHWQWRVTVTVASGEATRSGK